MNKKLIFILCAIILVVTIIFFIFYKNNYKTLNLGNNINTSAESVKEYILNLSSYEATIQVEVVSNKNSNKYILKQKFNNSNTFKQEVIEPQNIEGTIIEFSENNLKLENTKLQLSKIYENYNYLCNNRLCLNTFIEEYKNNNEASFKEENNQIILEYKIKNDSRYYTYQKLYIDKKTCKPVKMEIKDVNQNVLVNILYNEIKIDSTSKEVLA